MADSFGELSCSVVSLGSGGNPARTAENGATEHMLMSIYGWESPKQAVLYAKKARRKKLAQAGMRYLDGIEDLDIEDGEGAE